MFTKVFHAHQFFYLPRMVLQRSVEDVRAPGQRRSTRQWVTSLGFWCMNPAVTFHELQEECRSVLLASGTLSPMDTFSSELGVDFPIQVEAPHVIGKDRVIVLGDALVASVRKNPFGRLTMGSFILGVGGGPLNGSICSQNRWLL